MKPQTKFVSIMEDITKSEKAALYFQILERCTDWKEVYKIAIGEDRYNALTDKTKVTNTSRWKASHKIQKAREEIEMIFKAKQQEIEERTKGSNLSGETEPTNRTIKNEVVEKTNFLDRDEFLQFLNSRANAIQDDKLRNDILKMLSDNLRYKDTERDENNEIQRFYTPVTCENCTIYNKCKDCKLPQCPDML